MLSRAISRSWQLCALVLACGSCTSELGTPSPGPQGSGTGGSATATGGAAMGGSGVLTGGTGVVTGGSGTGTGPSTGGTGPGAGSGGGPPGPTTVEECAEVGKIVPGASPVRRLNRFEYNNTIKDLLGDDSAPADAFPLEEQSSFDNDATVLRVSRLLAEGYLSAAETLAKTALAKTTTLPCAATAATAATAAQEQCASSLIDSLGARAYRRPMTATEAARLLGVFRSARAFLDFQESLSVVMETMLNSPQFLYRLESGTPVDGNPGVLQVDPWSLASRLSYFLWGSMPDDVLSQAAREGRLVTAADVRREAERMYGMPRSRVVIRHFTRHWLELTTIDQQGKDHELFPDYTPEIGTLMRTQTETFAEHLYFDGGGTLGAMLSAPYTYMNQTLAKFMGVNGPKSDKFERVDLDPAKHAGVLTQPAFLSYNATVDRTHPILRGVFVMRKLLCDPPPAPPPGLVDGTGNATVPNPTQRERLEVHRTSPSCWGCHQFIDAIGLTFENFDAVGRWRDTEMGGRTIDATGGLMETDVDGPVSNAIELTKKLAQSAQVQRCVAVDWFRYANGRGESMQDSCSILKVADSLAKSGGDLRELVLAQTQTDAFLYRSEVKP